MSLPQIAFSEGDSLLFTIAGRELLARDAATTESKWTLAFDAELVGVAVAKAGVVALDADGTLHTVEGGKVVAHDGPYGAPVAFAASLDTIALATAGRVLVWRDGAKTETPLAVTALALGPKGRLAIGQDGAVVTFDVAKSEVVGTQKTDGRVQAVAAHWLEDAWLYGLEQGLFTGTRRLSGGDVRAIAVDPAKKRVAVARAETHAAVFRGDFDVPEMRIKYTNRKIRGVALRGPTLAVGLDRGDANLVDITTSKVSRTADDAAPEVEGARERAEAVEAEKRAARQREATVNTGAHSKKAIVIAALLIAGYLAIRVQAREQRAQSGAAPSPAMEACDLECETQRLDKLVQACDGKPCAAKSVEARTAFQDGRCDDAQRAVRDIRDGLSGLPPARALAAFADMGLPSACKANP